jgi:acetyl esterase/lipase
MSRSRHLTDPVLRPSIDAFPPLELNDQTLPMLREVVRERYASAQSASDADVSVQTIRVDRPSGGLIRVLAYRPRAASDSLPAVLHLHGGGYVMGVPELADRQHRAMAHVCNVAIYSVDYPLAPETIYPGQIEAAYAVLQWLHANADVLAIDRSRIGVKGESAGGGLAAALALLARDRGGPALAFQLLTFPALDDRTGSCGEPHPYCGEFLWTGTSNRFGWRSLLGREPGGSDTPAHAAPARAADVSALPPAFIAVGALDLYLEENLEYARRLARAGVPIELHVYPGAVHGFGIAPDSWVETVSERDLQEGLRRILARMDID